MSSFNKSSIGKKVSMALSALFLIIFLIIHLSVNIISVFNPDVYEEVSYFMGHNPLIQYVMQPILLIGVVYHFVMGFVIEIENRKARGGIGYSVNGSKYNSSWASRNMIYSGGFILIFLIIHLMDFWYPTVKSVYVDGITPDYYEHLVEEFQSPIRVALYVLGFIFLGLHLSHGFQSAFQSIGFNYKKYTPFLKKAGQVYSVLIPAGFIFIAVYYYIIQ